MTDWYPSAVRCRLAARFFGVVLLALFLVLMGCSHGAYQYTGVDFTTRSFNEDPDFRATYFGLDVNFTVAVDDPHVSTGPATRPISEY